MEINIQVRNHMCLLIYMTLPKDMDADKFCDRLVREGLAAGTNIFGPCRSVFSWMGEIRHEEEWIVIAQISEDIYEKFLEAVLAVHPYKTPCVISLPFEQGHAPFLKWIHDMCGEKRCV